MIYDSQNSAYDDEILWPTYQDFSCSEILTVMEFTSEMEFSSEQECLKFVNQTLEDEYVEQDLDNVDCTGWYPKIKFSSEQECFAFYLLAHRQ